MRIESDQDPLDDDELAEFDAAGLQHPDDDDVQTLVIVGNGMMSYRLCMKLVERDVQMHSRIVVFGEELDPAYDRVHLTDVFSGRHPDTLIFADPAWYKQNGIELHLGDPVVYVDREQSFVEAASGNRVPYNRLVFATGSEPFVPPIEGLKIADGELNKRVFVYRTFEDVYKIEAELERTSRAVIMGGGLLGLEAAKAVYDIGKRMHDDIEVEVVEAAPRLMPRQLDDGAATLLKEKIEQLGVHVHVARKMARVVYNEDVDRLTIYFDDQSELETDILIVSTGIRPRSELAKAAGIECAPNGGIKVDDELRTSDEQIYAIGECATHNGITYGLVGPGYQMVDVLVANLMGENARFTGADQSAKLKLLGVTVAALGEFDGDSKPLSSALKYTTGGVYRKLVTRQGRLIGAVTIGDWDNLDRIREALLSPAPMSFWDMRRFRSTGNLFPREESKKVTEWSADAVVCGCVRVTRGQLSLAIAAGATNVNELSKRTGAGTVCGSCKSLLSELIGEDELEAMNIALPAPDISLRDRTTMNPRAPGSARRDRPPPPNSRRTITGAEGSMRRTASGVTLVEHPEMVMPRQAAAGPYRTQLVADTTETTSQAVTQTIPAVKRTSTLAPGSGRRQGVAITGLQSMALPGQTPGVPYRPQLASDSAELQALDESIDNLYSSKRVPESDDGDSYGPPGSRRTSSRRQQRATGPIRATPSAADTIDAIRRALPPLTPEEEVEVGLSSDRAPALLEEGGVLSGELRVPSLPMPPTFEDNVFSGSEVIEEEEEEDYDTDDQFVELDGPAYAIPQAPAGLVNARRSWVPARARRSVRPAPVPMGETSAATAAKASPEPGYRQLATASIAAILLSVLAAFSRPLPVPTTSAVRLGIGRVWIDNAFQQTTGYLLVLLSIFSLVLSLRKRWKRFQLFDFPFFRVIHVLLGTMTLFVLAIHTGVRLGRGLEFALAVDFLAVVVLGSIAGIVTSVSHRWDGMRARDRRLGSIRVHLIAFWPLPVLVALHIFQVYYY